MKPQYPPQLIWLAAAMFGLIVINCNTLLPTPAPPTPPTPVAIQEVSDLTASRTELPINETAEITVSIIKILGDETPLTYQWSTTGGLITQGQGTCCIVYEAPDTPGGYQVHLTVGHGDQLFQRSLNLVVTGLTEPLSDTVAVEPTPTPTLVVPADESSPTANTAADASPLEDAAAYFNRAQESYTRRDYEQTLNDYTKAIELNYDPLGEAYYNRGFVYYAQRDYLPAVKDFTQAIELEREPLNQIYYNRGNAHYYLGNNDQAIEDYSRAIDLNHDPLSWLYNSRGLAYRKIGEFERAIEDYSQAIDLNHEPLHWPYYNRGNAYADLEQYARAIEDYNEAIRLAPNQPNAYYARGVAYQELGEESLARDDFKKVLEIGDDYWRQEAQTRLDEPATEETNP